MIIKINKGESFLLNYKVDDSTDLTGYTCKFQIRSTDNKDFVYEKAISDTVNNNKTFIGYIEPSDTENIDEGTYNLNAIVLNPQGNRVKQFQDTLTIEEALIVPTPAFIAAEQAVTLAEYTTTAEDVAAAQLLIDGLPDADQAGLQTRLDAVYVTARWIEAVPSEFNLVETPWLDSRGLAVRSPNFRVSQRLDKTIFPQSGWASVHIVIGAQNPQDRTLDSFWGIGDLTAIVNGGFQDLLPGDRDKAVTAGNSIYFEGVQQPGDFTNVIIAVDYRTAAPHVYIIDVNTGTLAFDTELNITGNVDMVARCSQNSALERNWFYTANTGMDLNNSPFPADAEAILIGEGVDTTGYVIGWGGNGSRDNKTGTTQINITGITPPVPTLGDTVTVTASVIDGYGVDRSADVVWYNKFFNWNNAESVQTGASMTCTPEVYGYFEGVAEYTDTNGEKVTAPYVIDIQGNSVISGVTEFSVANSHPNIGAILDNQVRFQTATPFKLAAIGTNPMRGRFCYVEFALITLDTSSQFGFGITSVLNAQPFARDGSIMWSGIIDGLYPQDGAGAGTYLEAFAQDGFLDMPFVNGSNLIAFPTQLSNSDRFNTAFYHGGVNGSETAYLGMAVDYRDTTKAPIVYAFHQEFGTGIDKVVGNFVVNNCRTEVVPTIYCNNGSNETVIYDCSINGGSFGAFAIDPRPLLTAGGVDISAFEYGWTPAEIQP